MRYSFLSLAKGPSGARLVAGSTATTTDHPARRLRDRPGVVAAPGVGRGTRAAALAVRAGVEGMQGATVVDGR